MKPNQPLLVLICVSLFVSGCNTSSNDEARILEVDVFKGGFATVNSFVFSNGKSLIVMDVQRKTYEAEKLVDLIKAKSLPLTHILITHGHTDHFTEKSLLKPWAMRQRYAERETRTIGNRENFHERSISISLPSMRAKFPTWTTKSAVF